jgi:hypothetical protein
MTLTPKDINYNIILNNKYKNDIYYTAEKIEIPEKLYLKTREANAKETY